MNFYIISWISYWDVIPMQQYFGYCYGKWSYELDE